MTIDQSRRALLAFTMIAVSSAALTAAPALAIAKPAIRSDVKTHRVDKVPVPREPTAQRNEPAAGPFAILHLE